MTIPDHELRRLATAVSGRASARLVSEPLDEPERARLDALVERRLAGEPLQYLEGSVDFGPIELAVDRRALIPRPETERVWEEAKASLAEAGPGTVIVDLGTGSGALALALKHEFPEARVFGIDVSEDALALAEENAERTGLDVTFLHGDLFDPLPSELRGRVDLVVSNPPYVAESDLDSLPADVSEHEPHVALFAGPDGTEILQRIAEEAFWWVGIGGWVVCEIGETQGDAVDALFGMYDREVRQDLTGRDRMIVARKGASCCR